MAVGGSDGGAEAQTLDAQTLESESLAVVPVASVFAVRSTAERPLDPLNPPRLNDPNDTRLGAYRFELGYFSCGGGTPATDKAVFTVTRSGGDLSQPLAVSLNPPGGTAKEADGDFQPLPRAVIIPANATSAPIELSPIDDEVVEPTESVILTLQAGSDYQLGTPSTATANISDNDALPTISIAATQYEVAEWAGEGSPGLNGSFVVTATLPSAPTTSRTVIVELTPGGTATETADYGSGYVGNDPMPRSVSIIIPALSRSASTEVPFHAIDDLIDEATETIDMHVGTNANYAILAGNGMATVALASGDYTFHSEFQEAEPGPGQEVGNLEEAQRIPVRNDIDRWAINIDDANDGNWPETERTIGIQIYKGGSKVQGTRVTLNRDAEIDGGKVVILDGNVELDRQVRATDAEGIATFRLRYKAGNPGVGTA